MKYLIPKGTLVMILVWKLPESDVKNSKTARWVSTVLKEDAVFTSDELISNESGDINSVFSVRTKWGGKHDYKSLSVKGIFIQPLDDGKIY